MKFSLFLSSSCVYSLKLIDVLENLSNNNWRSYFYVYDISEKWLYDAIKSNSIITETPTLRVSVDDDHKIFVGMDEIINFVKNINFSAQKKQKPTNDDDNLVFSSTNDDDNLVFSSTNDKDNFVFSSTNDNNDSKPTNDSEKKSLAEEMQADRESSLSKIYQNNPKKRFA